MKKVLLVDDDLFFAELVSDVLTNYQVFHCQNAPEAIAKIDDIAPDVIILDLLMPAATGFSLLQELVSYDDLNQIPIIVCSSVASEVSDEFLKTAGVCEVLDKNQIAPTDIKLALKRLGI